MLCILFKKKQRNMPFQATSPLNQTKLTLKIKVKKKRKERRTVMSMVSTDSTGPLTDTTCRPLTNQHISSKCLVRLCFFSLLTGETGCYETSVSPTFSLPSSLAQKSSVGPDGVISAPSCFQKKSQESVVCKQRVCTGL